MSQKLEFLKDAVFYAQQKPEALASILEGLVADVLSAVNISGPDSVQLKAAESVTADFSGTAMSQFGDAMSNAVTLSLNEAVTGVSISGNTVTLTKDVTATSFTIKGVSGSVTALKTIAIVAAE